MTLFPIRSRIILQVVLLGLILVGILLTRSGEDATSDGLIAFVSDQDGNYEIYTVTFDGSSTRNLTNNAATDMFPVWSPDGQYIAFVSNRDNADGDIFVMKADGSDVRNLTNNHGSDQGGLTWSPDGQYIAFVSNRDNADGDIFVVSVENGLVKNLTNDTTGALSPNWSSDGKRIAFVSGQPREVGVSLIDFETLEVRSVVAPLENKSFWFPCFSPIANQIAFLSVDGDLHITDDEGEQAVNTPRKFMPPVSWSPDGMWLASASWGDNTDMDLSLINKNDLTVREIAHENFDDMSPVWSPDGNYIATLSSHDGIADIFIFSVDGKEIRRLTNNVLRIGSGTPIELIFGQLDWKS